MPAVRAARILIVDDELPVLRAYRRILDKEHAVSLAWGGREALHLLERDSCFDLVLCDVMMPGVGGADVHAHLVAHLPELAERLVFCSGGMFSEPLRRYLQSLPNPVLEKPVPPARLRELAQRYALRISPAAAQTA